MSITRALAEWSANVDPAVCQPAYGLARNAIIDITACMVAGAGDQSAQRGFAAVAGLGAGAATVVGQALSLPAPAAALVNGTAAHALDFDDNFHPLAGHATAVLAPALFALAEETGAGGSELLAAYVIGLEVMACIGNAVNLEHYERGWHSTSTVGAMGAAAACARLMRLDADGMQAAISLGFSMAGGSKLQFGTMTKPLHVGLTAQSGLMAARFAAEGITAAPEPLDSPWGFRDLFAGPDSPGFAGARKRIGSPLAIMTYGLKVKIHPCCASVHCAVDGVIGLMKTHELCADDIQRVDTVVNRVSYDNLMYPQPDNEMEARFSMHYCVALAVLNGKIQRSDFFPRAIDDPAVRAWLPRVSMKMPQGKELARADNGREPAQSHLRLNDGRVLSTFVQHAKGVLQNPLSDAELWAKFEDCTRDVLQPASITRIKPLLMDFEGLSDVGRLMKLLRQPGKDAAGKL